MDTAASINVPEYIIVGNQILGFDFNGAHAHWLTGDQVLFLASEYNPDGAGAAPGWFSGPGPFNFWQTFFARTLLEADGQVHIMVVNTAIDAGIAHATGEITPGSHWFTVAWVVDPAGQGD